MTLSTVILAAGKGSRMNSELPKVLHTVGGIPLLQHVINAARQLNDNTIHIVYGNGGDRVRSSFSALSDIHWVSQTQQYGTGHAVQQALPACGKNDRVLVLYGDVPLIQVKILKQLLSETPPEGLGLLVAKVSKPAGLGRIIRDKQQKVTRIVEDRDANSEQKKITEINTGIMVCPQHLLAEWLPLLQTHNQQQEYYLTDVVALAVKNKISVTGICVDDADEVQGVNDLWQLANVERYYQQRQARKFALSGVKLLDYQRFDIRGNDIEIAVGVVIDINVILEGRIRIAKNVTIGANCILKDCEISEGVTILPNTVIDGAVIKSGVQVGPFSRIRPETILEKNSKVGNFVEIKKTCLGESSKANHLSYLGDTMVGNQVNIGAGTITCNYDGVNKSQTVIKDGAFVGSNTALVAPVIVGEKATIGAGSTITQNAPDKALTVSRSKQKSFEGWKK